MGGGAALPLLGNESARASHVRWSAVKMRDITPDLRSVLIMQNRHHAAFCPSSPGVLSFLGTAFGPSVIETQGGAGRGVRHRAGQFLCCREFSPFQAHGQRQPLDKIPNGVLSNSQELLNLIVILIITEVVLITE